MITEKHEEILEAVFTGQEMRDMSRISLNRRCTVPFTDADISHLQQEGYILCVGTDITLTPRGERIATAIIRRHRLAEVLVTSILKLKKSEMEDIACKVEHSLLPEVEEAICTLLGHPAVCPDGKPIPRGRCCSSGRTKVDSVVTRLSDLENGEKGKITYIKPVSHANFHQLISFGLHPGVTVTVHRKTPAFCVKYENTELALDDRIADNIFVWRLNGEQ